MYNTILLNLTSNLNPNDFMLLLITFIWVGYIIYSYTKKNSITKKGKEVLKSIKEIIKKESIHMDHELTQIKNFFYNMINLLRKNPFGMFSNKSKYHIKYYTTNFFKTQLNFVKKISYKVLEKFEGNLSFLNVLLTASIGVIILFKDEIIKSGGPNMSQLTIILTSFCISFLWLLHFLQHYKTKRDEEIKKLDVDLFYESKLKKITELYDKKEDDTIKYVFFFLLVLCIINFCIFSWSHQKQLELVKEDSITNQQDYITKFNDFYLEESRQDFNDIFEDEIIYNDFTFKISKNEEQYIIVYQLINTTTKEVIRDKSLQYKKDLN